MNTERDFKASCQGIPSHMTDSSSFGLHPRRVLVIPNEFPLPPNSGGRVDVWRRLRVLRDDLKYELSLLTWFDMPRDGAPSDQALAEMAQVVQAVHITPIRRSPAELVKRLLQMVRWPSHAASRWVTLDRRAALTWARAFRPDVILLDGLYGAPVAAWLSRELGVPVVYRSHNIEHLYMRKQLRKTTGWKSRLGLLANLIHLEGLERRALSASRQVLDISMDDLSTWEGQGVQHLRWLPPSVDAAFAAALAAPNAEREPSCELLYFGNLNTPNNVDALRWLVTEILPRLNMPGLRVHVAGSRPSAEAQALCAQDHRIRLIANPPDMAFEIKGARVLINPVLEGSGVNVKAVEMLFTDAALVSTPVGVQGLPQAAQQCFSVSTSAQDFAAAIAGHLAHPTQPDLQARSAARAPFLPTYAAQVMAQALQDAVR